MAPRDVRELEYSSSSYNAVTIRAASSPFLIQGDRGGDHNILVHGKRNGVACDGESRDQGGDGESGERVHCWCWIDWF